MNGNSMVETPLRAECGQHVIIAGNETYPVDQARKITQAKKTEQHSDWDESFYLCDVGTIVSQVKLWKRELPMVKAHYAVKSNPLQPVLRVLGALGLGFDCASKREIQQVLQTGVKPSEIIFAHTCKFPTHLKFAKENGVRRMTVDNEEELYKIRTIYPTATLLLRLKANESYTASPFGNKFGASLEELQRLLRIAKDLNLNVIGVSFHIGSNSTSSIPFDDAMQSCRKMFDYAKSIGYDFTVLDIGGGFPGGNEILFLQMAEAIRKSISQLFAPQECLEIIAEPGRFFVDSAFCLITNVIGKRITTNARSYYISDGLYTGFDKVRVEKTQCHPEPLNTVNNRIGSEEEYQLIVYGPTCDGSDVITNEISTMCDVAVGDWLIWRQMGAYSVLMSFGFNGYFTNAAYYFISRSNFEEMMVMTKSKEMLPKFIDKANNDVLNQNGMDLLED